MLDRGELGKPSGTRREKQKSDTRAAILMAARKLFGSKGFQGAKIRGIAREAGVGTGTIFSHFEDKRALLVETVIEDLEEIQERAWATLPEDRPLLERLLHLASSGFDYWGQYPSLTRALMRETYFTPGAARDRLLELDQKAFTRYVAYLAVARDRGELSRETDPELLARTAFSFYLTTVLMGLDHLEVEQSQEIGFTKVDAWIGAMVDQARAFLELLFRGAGNY